jgi:5-methylcytosine-specific restriction protein A
MPNKCPHPCNKPGCHRLTTERFCEEHAKAAEQQYDKQRGTASERGYGVRWQRYRLMFLRQHPLCECDECRRSARLLPATDVDHIKAVSGPDDPLFWEPTNHRALSHSCHSRKTVREDGRWGKSR